MDRLQEIRFVLNGKEASYTGSAADRLLDVLREQFRCTGVKCGCREGECGACAVLIDGLLRNSCCVAMGAVEGTSIVTIEGYRETARFAVLDRAFAQLSAVQCGFCTPGMILAAEALLSAHPHPTEEEIREGLSGNLCRCTGYNAIVNAVKSAAEEGEGLW
ncbi:MAG: (2Fe-2S)-binding protein [Oscillospiraceae bacterium]|nr:(2Fe-2S)-binding protein [Oscillospiraceae bacterium]